MKICVIGLGYIGLPTACLFADAGYEVIGVDVNQETIGKLNQGKLPFEEKGLEEIFENALPNMIFETRPEAADVFLIAVPTPLDKEAKMADLRYVREATKSISNYIKGDSLVILESTVPPGTSERLILPMLKNKAHFVHCPERAIPGNTIHEMIYNDRIIGSTEKESGEHAKEIYSSFVKGNIYLTNLRTAEMVKIMENTFRDINIALANEFAQIAEESGVNIWAAIELANKHPRVNILKPGPGVGGHCIAIDPWFLVENSVRSRIVNLAREINESMPRHVLRLVKELGIGTHSTITVLGVAYKSDVDDTRETPALKFIKLAENEGYTVKVHDPYVQSFEYEILSLDVAVKDSDCIVIITDHSKFKDIDPGEISKLMRKKFIVDSRNILDQDKWRKAGFNVKVLGMTDYE
ncbi:MAG: nucleotide sugar dehydrogenase [Methanophagales archaeon]|nr:nucleotide sugar dehydrogenase [Methanophagales archaeon]